MKKSTRQKMANAGLIVIAVLIYLAGMAVGAWADLFLETFKG